MRTLIQDTSGRSDRETGFRDDPGTQDRGPRDLNRRSVERHQTDIFQKGSGSQFDIGARRQEFRQAVAFGVTYIRDAPPAEVS